MVRVPVRVSLRLLDERLKGGGGEFLAGLVVAALLSKALAQPFSQLASVATAVGNGDFSQPPVRIKNWHPRDVRSLIVTVSWMIEQQQKKVDAAKDIPVISH